MDSPTDTARNAVAISYNPSFIALSYMVSLIGSMTTVELLHRRTSFKGAYNWYLLLASCITMGGCGIWSMHFIGNQAIILEDDDPAKQIAYDPGFTCLSFFLPIAMLFVAFSLLGDGERAASSHIILCGILTGAAVCGMHYVGQLALVTHDCIYNLNYLLGSATIAVLASLIALSVFFRLRDKWTNVWWKRSLCATLLACAVSGMHWTATVGTSYLFKRANDPRSGSRLQTIIVCVVLSVGACTLLLAFAVLAGRRHHLQKARVQQLILACAYFDDQGRLMVTTDGILPCQKITDRFVERRFGEDELSRSHPTFAWLFEASQNWATLNNILPYVHQSLHAKPGDKHYGSGHEVLFDDDHDISANFSVIFKQMFCLAAAQLAADLNASIKDLGLLFEEPLETGTFKPQRRIKTFQDLRKLSLPSCINEVEDVSMDQLSNGGKYLFLTRCITGQDVAKFAALGYRFGSASQLAPMLARHLQVHHETMLLNLERMRAYCGTEHLPAAGIHLAAFICRPSVHKRFDVLVPRMMQSQLPMISLTTADFNDQHHDILKRFNDWPVKQVLRALVNESSDLELNKEFRWQLHSAFTRLVDLIGDSQMMMQAIFSSYPAQTPCRVSYASRQADTCTLYTVRLMENIHSRTPRDELVYVPLGFFELQQHTVGPSTSHQEFMREFQSAFGHGLSYPFNGRRDTMSSIPSRESSKSSAKLSFDCRALKDAHLIGSANMSLKYHADELKTSVSSQINPRMDVVMEKLEGQTVEHFETVPEVHMSARPEIPSIFIKNANLKIGNITQQGTSSIAVRDERNSYVAQLFALFRLSVS